MDEADQFKANPASFLYSMFKDVGRDTLPSHVVLYDSMEQRVQKFFQTEKYSLVCALLSKCHQLRILHGHRQLRT